MEKEAGAPGASPLVTPGKASAASVVVRMPRSCISRWLTTSTVAGISRAGRSSRLALSATAPVLSGVSGAGVPAAPAAPAAADSDPPAAGAAEPPPRGLDDLAAEDLDFAAPARRTGVSWVPDLAARAGF